ncbi:ferric iron uptake transcriptional regulator [uncultured Tolumonas sp.]|uniref:ferric iron uptake transcriptional regulator n=1 Tax=uncultured Tolumonas sp. TaxID=263765 RepID=UPI002A0A6C2D|nr:ferric iron uptake transcriptional regulator [uncultured Tolumonas sp.]
MSIKKLKKAGLKITNQRMTVLDYLSGADEHHLSAEDIFRDLRLNGADVGQATVYRVLNQLEKAGMLERHHFEGSKAYYELKSKDHHDHLVCLRCGKIVEFFDPFIEQRQKEIAEQYGMQLSHHHLYMFGYCSDPNCRLNTPVIIRSSIACDVCL